VSPNVYTTPAELDRFVAALAAEARASDPPRVLPRAGPARHLARMNILVVDVGGTHVKLLATNISERVKLDSGPGLTPEHMVAAVRAATAGWAYDAVSIGYPGPVRHNGPAAEPHNLGPGWVGFDFGAAFGARCA
jgi:hypothetical protein